MSRFARPALAGGALLAGLALLSGCAPQSGLTITGAGTALCVEPSPGLDTLTAALPIENTGGSAITLTGIRALGTGDGLELGDAAVSTPAEGEPAAIAMGAEWPTADPRMNAADAVDAVGAVLEPGAEAILLLELRLAESGGGGSLVGLAIDYEQGGGTGTVEEPRIGFGIVPLATGCDLLPREE